MKIERRWRGLLAPALALALLVVGGAGRAAEAPRVVVSLKPIHALAAGVMGEVGAPVLLISGLASPHSYALRPSEARALERADLVVWVGPTMESFLIRPLASLPKARVLTLVEAKGMTLLPIRAGGLFETDDHDDAPGGIDGHVWLDPANARAIVAALRERLTALDPAHADVYARNAAKVDADLAALDREIAATLYPLAGAPFIVFHDAYQYLERRYDLAAAGSVTLGAEAAAHARRIAELRKRVALHHIQCVFAEPQFNPALVATVIESTDARAGVLDHLGATVPAGPAAYGTILRNLAGALKACLAP